MSKRNEIRKKEQIQLQLQSQFNKLDQTVLSWLDCTEDGNNKHGSKSSDITSEFINQIVIPTGKGINFAEDDENIDTSKKTTINDFLDNINTKKSNKNGMNKIDKIGDVKRRKGNHSNSNSLRALSNKLRNDKRNKERVHIENKSNRSVKVFASTAKQSITKKGNNDRNAHGDSDSEDSDDEILKRKSKNSSNGKSINKNKRPF